MIKNIKYLSPPFLLIMLFLISCEKEPDDNSSISNITNQFSNLETDYYTGIKIENTNFPKIETEASQGSKDSLWSKIMATKQTTYLKSTRSAGVLRWNGTCGSNQTIEVFMDCEDNRPDSWKRNYTGDSYIDGNKNLHLFFCRVSGDLFQKTNFEYAVLQLGDDLPQGCDGVTREFENETTDNTNWWKLDGYYEETGWVGGCCFTDHLPWPVLSWVIYRAQTTPTTMPNLGYSYGVLGKFGSYQGSIHTDDEDSNNSNDAYLNIWNGSSWTLHHPIANNAIPNLMDLGYNTTMYVSKAR